MSRKLYTERQKAFVMESISAHKDIIESKRNDLATNLKKNKAWSSVAEAFNAEFAEDVTGKALNQLYRKWKSLARKELVEVKQYRNRTGGGPPIPHNYSATTSSILDLDNDIVLTIPNPYDNAINVDENIHPHDESNSHQSIAQQTSQKKMTIKKDDMLLLEHNKRMEVLEVQRQTYLKQQLAFDTMREAAEVQKEYYKQWITRSGYHEAGPHSTPQWYQC